MRIDGRMEKIETWLTVRRSKPIISEHSDEKNLSLPSTLSKTSQEGFRVKRNQTVRLPL